MKSNVSDGQSPDPFPLLCMTGKGPSLHDGLIYLILPVGALPLLVTPCAFGCSLMPQGCSPQQVLRP